MWRGHWGLLAVALVLVAGTATGVLTFGGWALSIPFNLIFLGHAVLFVLQGLKSANIKLVSLACLIFAGLVLARYLDLFESLLMRSLVFLLLGAGLFLVGNFYTRRKRQSGATET